ncbi:MAG: GIY-YIG nuclease family protein [Lentisphaerae bacterium]|nr:GIY-YIG nuclease family protein [Lentisphaerota bacterium]
MHYVYIIRSTSHPEQRYIGITNDIDSRLNKHNAGGSPHTSRYCPWSLETSIGFSDKTKAAAFERYLKTGSGFAFAKKHF